MLRDNFVPASAPKPANPNLVRRLQAAADRRDGNLVVFRGRSAFSGSGRRMSREQVVIDVSRGKKEDDGTVQEPLPFKNSDVHKAFLDAIGEITFRDMRLEERMFINGKHVHGNLGLQRDRCEAPRSFVSKELLRRTAEHPAPDARVYVCAEVHGWQGQQMVTMFARAVHTGGWLYIEWSFHVLPPISTEFTMVDHLYEERKLRKLRETFARSLRGTCPALLASPLVTFGELGRRLEWKSRESRQAYRINHGQIFDYGAKTSVREEASGLRISRHYFLERDEVMYVLLLQKTLIREIGKFLDRHNIEQAEFEAQAKIIIDASFKNYNVHVGEGISNSNISVGEGAKSGGGKEAG